MSYIFYYFQQSKARRKSNKLEKKRVMKSDSEGEGSHLIDDDREERRHSQWVQCDNPQCQKWRRIDAADCLEEYVAAKWVCGMNKGIFIQIFILDVM